MGFSLGIVVLAIVIVAIVRLSSRARWTHVASRRLALLVLAAGFLAMLAGGALAGGSTP
jgi:hypothetical protein